MSQDNVDIVPRHMVAFVSGDYEGALAAYHPEVVCDATVRPEGRVYQGREGVAEAIRVWAGTWDDWRWELDELIDAGDRVVMVVHEFARGKVGYRWSKRPSGSTRCEAARLSTRKSWSTGAKPSRPPGCRVAPSTAPMK